MAKCRIIPVQICGIRLYNKELGTCAVRGRTSCHGNRSPYMGNIIFYAIIGKFTFDGLIRSTSSIALWITTLNHKSVNDPMESQSVIKVLLYQFYKICYCNRCCIRIQFHINLAVIFHCDCCMISSGKLLAGINYCSTCFFCVLGTI